LELVADRSNVYFSYGHHFSSGFEIEVLNWNKLWRFYRPFFSREHVYSEGYVQRKLKILIRTLRFCRGNFSSSLECSQRSEEEHKCCSLWRWYCRIRTRTEIWIRHIWLSLIWLRLPGHNQDSVGFFRVSLTKRKQEHYRDIITCIINYRIWIHFPYLYAGARQLAARGSPPSAPRRPGHLTLSDIKQSIKFSFFYTWWVMVREHAAFCYPAPPPWNLIANQCFMQFHIGDTVYNEILYSILFSVHIRWAK
jgi:hypothetical protein